MSGSMGMHPAEINAIELRSQIRELERRVAEAQRENAALRERAAAAEATHHAGAATAVKDVCALVFATPLQGDELCAAVRSTMLRSMLLGAVAVPPSVLPAET
jgi:hypothetical protein